MLKSTLGLLLVITFFRGGVYCDEVKLSNYAFIGGKYQRIMYTCKSTGRVGNILSWYQVKGKTTLLRRIQHTSEKMELTLNLTLQEKDNNTQIFCVKGMLHDPNRIESVKAMITFMQKSTPLETPYVTVTPDDNPVYFEVNTNRTFICNGSQPVDGRKLTWYIQGPDSKPKYVNTQIWHNESYINTLLLHLSETYHQKKLFCAQDFQFNYTNDGTSHIESYGQIAKSTMILLHLNGTKENEREANEKDNEESKESGNGNGEIGEEDVQNGTGEDNMTGGLQRGSSASPLVYAIPIVVVALLLIAATVWLLWRRRTLPPVKVEEESIYATPKVSYVTLDHKNSTEYASSAVQETPYAQIIGILNPTIRKEYKKYKT